MKKALFLLLLLVLCGCMKLEQAYPAKRYYALEAPVPEALQTPLAAGILKVRRFDIAPQFASQEWVYRMGALEYQSDYYHVFLVAPEDLLTQATQQWLAGLKLFDQVLEGPTRLGATHVLEGHVLELYGDYRDPANRAACMKITFALIEETGEGSRLVLHQTCEGRAPLADRTPEALAAGWNQALEKILLQLSEALRAAL